MAVYRAERHLDGAQLHLTQPSAAADTERLAAHPLIAELAPHLSGGVQVKFSTRMRYDGWASKPNIIRYRWDPTEPVPFVCQTLILHELSHLVARTGGHGPQFIATFDQLLTLATWHQWDDMTLTPWHQQRPLGPRLQLAYRAGLAEEGLGALGGEDALPDQLRAALGAGRDEVRAAIDEIDPRTPIPQPAAIRDRIAAHPPRHT